MDVKELSEGRFRRADNNRATLLGLVAQCLGDDFIELLDGTYCRHSLVNLKMFARFVGW